MKLIFVSLVLALLGLAAFTRYEVEIMQFLHTTPQGTLVVMGLIGALILAELSKGKPKKKAD